MAKTQKQNIIKLDSDSQYDFLYNNHDLTKFTETAGVINELGYRMRGKFENIKEFLNYHTALVMILSIVKICDILGDLHLLRGVPLALQKMALVGMISTVLIFILLVGTYVFLRRRFGVISIMSNLLHFLVISKLTILHIIVIIIPWFNKNIYMLLENLNNICFIESDDHDLSRYDQCVENIFRSYNFTDNFTNIVNVSFGFNVTNTML